MNKMLALLFFSLLLSPCTATTSKRSKRMITPIILIAGGIAVGTQIVGTANGTMAQLIFKTAQGDNLSDKIIDLFLPLKFSLNGQQFSMEKENLNTEYLFEELDRISGKKLQYICYMDYDGKIKQLSRLQGIANMFYHAVKKSNKDDNRMNLALCEKLWAGQL